MTNSSITMRAATLNDADLLSDILTASYATLADGSYDPERLRAALPFMSRPNPKLLASGTYYVALVDGQAGGCGGWTIDRPGTGEIVDGVAHIRHFATHPAHLRKGIARLLLDRCLSEAAAVDVRLMMSQSTLPAEKFYASAGFRRIRPIEVEMGPSVLLPAIEMARELP